MEIRVSGKNIDLGEVLRHQAEHRLNDVIRKYVDSNYSGHITVARDGIGFKTECAVRFDHGPVMHVTGEAPDAYQALSVAIERMAKSLRRFKRKKDKHGADRMPMNGFDPGAGADFAVEDDDEDIVATTGAGAVIIAEAVADAPQHSTTSAVAALERSDSPFLVFRNAGTGRVNVLYRRKDGHYGWVDIG